MQQWEKTARVMKTLATADAEGDLRMSIDAISEESGLRPAAVRTVLGGLERAGLVKARLDLRPHDGGQRRFHRLTEKAQRVDEVRRVLFGPSTGATRVTGAIVAALWLAIGGRRDGWVAAEVVAAVAGVDPKYAHDGPLRRDQGMQDALKRLESAGLLERRDTANPGRWRGEYRLRLHWAPDRPSLVAVLARALLNTSRRNELLDFASGEVAVTWFLNDKLIAKGHFGASGASIHIVHAGIDVEFEGDGALGLRDCGTRRGQGENAAESPDRG